MAIYYFQINLATLQQYSAKQPYDQYKSSNNTSFATSRSTWIPNQLLNNHQWKNGTVVTNNQSDTTGAVVISDYEALYIFNNYTSGAFAFATVTSVTATDSSGVNTGLPSWSSSSSSTSSSSTSSSSSSRSSSSSSSSS